MLFGMREQSMWRRKNHRKRNIRNGGNGEISAIFLLCRAFPPFTYCSAFFFFSLLSFHFLCLLFVIDERARTAMFAPYLIHKMIDVKTMYFQS